MKVYCDKRGWLYKVMPGIGGDCWKARYCKIRQNSWHAVTILPWRDTPEQAQADLDQWAAKKGMTIVEKPV